MQRERILTAGRLTEKDLSLLGESLRQVFKVEKSHGFDALLKALDQVTPSAR